MSGSSSVLSFSYGWPCCCANFVLISQSFLMNSKLLVCLTASTHEHSYQRVHFSFLDESGHLEHEVPDVAEVPPFERPPFPGAHGVRRRLPPQQPPPSKKNVRRHGRQTCRGSLLCIVCPTTVFFPAAGFLIERGVIRRRPGAAPPLPARDLDRRGQLRRGLLRTDWRQGRRRLTCLLDVVVVALVMVIGAGP